MQCPRIFIDIITPGAADDLFTFLERSEFLASLLTEEKYWNFVIKFIFNRECQKREVTHFPGKDFVTRYGNECSEVALNRFCNGFSKICPKFASTSISLASADTVSLPQCIDWQDYFSTWCWLIRWIILNFEYRSDTFLGFPCGAVSCSICPPLRMGIKFWNGQYNIFKNTTYPQKEISFQTSKTVHPSYVYKGEKWDECDSSRIIFLHQWNQLFSSLEYFPLHTSFILFSFPQLGFWLVCFGRGWSDAKSVLKKVIYDSLTAIATWFVKCECRIGLDRGTASGVCTKKRSTEMAQQKNPQKNFGSFFRNSWTILWTNLKFVCQHGFSLYLPCVFHESHNLLSRTFWC